MLNTADVVPGLPNTGESSDYIFLGALVVLLVAGASLFGYAAYKKHLI